MRRKYVVTVALSTLFASAQMAFLPAVSVHAAAQPNLWAKSHVEVLHGKSLETSPKKFTLNSEGLRDIKDLAQLLGIGVALPG